MFNTHEKDSKKNYQKQDIPTDGKQKRQNAIRIVIKDSVKISTYTYCLTQPNLSMKKT